MFAKKILSCVIAGCVLSSNAAEIDVLIVEGSQSSEAKSGSLQNNQKNFRPLATEAADLFVGLPGIQVDSRSNYAQDSRVSIRGFGARSAFGIRGIDLILDGIPINTPDGQGQLSSVQLDSLQSVELISGPRSVLYGNSPGGVVLLNSRIPEANKLELQYAGSNQDQDYAQINAGIRENNLAISAQANYQQNDTDRPHSKTEKYQQALAVYYTTEAQLDWIIKYDKSHDPLLEDPLGLTPAQFAQNPFQENPTAIAFNTRKSVDNQQISAMLRQTQGDSRWQIGVWQSERAIEQFLGFAGDALSSAGGVVDLQRDVQGINANFTQDFTWLNINWRASTGIELTRMQDDRQGFVNQQGQAGDLRRDESGEVTNRDGFVLLELWPVESTRIYLGGRYTDMKFSVEDYFVLGTVNPDDSGKKQFSESAIATGIEYQFADDWSLFANLSKGFETPTLTEMAYNNNNTGLNTDLSASEQQQAEWGVLFSTADWQWKFTQFQIQSEQDILVDQSINGRTTFRNELETERKGYELFHRQIVNAQWQTQLSIQYLDAEFSKGRWQSNQLPGVAKEVYQAGVIYQPFASSLLSIDLDTQYRSKVATADNNQVFADSWQVWNLSVQSELQPNLHLSLRINNLADKIYAGSVIVNQANGRALEPALGRNIWLGSRISF